jgi:hypothetical protein
VRCANFAFAACSFGWAVVRMPGLRTMGGGKGKWAIVDSNHRPRSYQDRALAN